MIDENNARLDENSVCSSSNPPFATFTYFNGGVDTGKARSSEHAGGADKVRLSYAHNFPLTLVFDALGTLRTYVYATKFGVERTSTAEKPGTEGGTVSTSKIVFSKWSYDEDGNIKSYVDYRGNRTDFIYDLARNLEISRTEAAGTPVARTITTEWHPDFRVPTRITEPNRVTEFDYKTDDTRRCGVTAGRLCGLTVTDARGPRRGTSNSRTWSFAYDDDGQIERINGPRFIDKTRYEYDGQGNLQSVINAAGHRTTFSDYDDHGRPQTIVDPNRLETTLVYDKRGRLVSQQVGEELTTYEYDGVGQLIKLTRPDGSFLRFTYDGAHRLTAITDNLGNTIRYTLDPMGNPKEEQVFDPSGVLARTQTRIYDALNRLKSSVGATGQTTSFEYDDNDNLIGITDPLDPDHKTPPWSYDALDRLTSSADLNRAQTNYGYDAHDHLTQVTVAVRQLDQVTEHTYDGLDNQTSTDSPDSGLTEYVYDEAGNVVSRTDGRGQETTYSYDQLNRVEFAGGEVAFRYDEGENSIGRLTQMFDETGTTQWEYDAHGRVVRKTQEVGNLTFVTRYKYNSGGRLESIFCPSGQHVHLDYIDGQVALISANGLTLLGNIEYEPFGPASKWIWGNGITYDRTFDLDGRVEAYDLGEGRHRQLVYDDSGRITEYVDADPIQSQSFDYDAAGALTEFTSNEGTTFLDLDSNDNRIGVTSDEGTDVYTYDEPRLDNQPRSIEGLNPRTYEYDDAGNVISIATSDGIKGFEYDSRGRLILATEAQGGTEYLINGLGQRVAKLGHGRGSFFVHDEDGRLLGEYDHRGVPVQEFVYLDDLLVAVLMREGRFFVYPDHLGTPRAIAEARSKVVWRWDSDPFGATPPDEDPNRNGSAFTLNLRFPGQYFDQETGLFHNGFRDYDPQTGRYIQVDPIGLEGSLNPYLYAEGNPLTFIDPFGLGATNGSATSDGSSNSADDSKSGGQCGGGAGGGAGAGGGSNPFMPPNLFPHDLGPPRVSIGIGGTLAEIIGVTGFLGVEFNPGGFSEMANNFALVYEAGVVAGAKTSLNLGSLSHGNVRPGITGAYRTTVSAGPAQVRFPGVTIGDANPGASVRASFRDEMSFGVGVSTDAVVRITIQPARGVELFNEMFIRWLDSCGALPFGGSL